MSQQKPEALDLSPSQEMYLKTIYQLCQEQKVARVKDIAAQLNVTMSSVNGAIKGLVGRNYCVHTRYGYVDLTPEGEKLAQTVIGRFEVIVGFLHDFLGVDRETANHDACEMEHIVSPVTLDRIVKLQQLIQDRNEGQEFRRLFRSLVD